jgi:hypothetical protein
MNPFSLIDSDPSGLLPPMLEGKQSKIGEFSNILSWGKDPKNATGFLWFIWSDWGGNRHIRVGLSGGIIGRKRRMRVHASVQLR